MESLSIRWSRHVSKAMTKERSSKLYRRIRQYGRKNFTIQKISSVFEHRLDIVELQWIDRLDTINKGLNSKRGGYYGCRQ
jgi:hypothetical protein